MPITPPTGSFFHAETQRSDTPEASVSKSWISGNSVSNSRSSSVTIHAYAREGRMVSAKLASV
jgi:hypothetical protein